MGLRCPGTLGRSLRVPEVLRSPIGIVGLALLVLGAFAASQSFLWLIEEEYYVRVDAPGGLEWTLWVPRHDTPMAWSVTGELLVAGPVETIHGVLLNLTGSGSAQVRFSRMTPMVGLDWLDLDAGVDLSGAEGRWPNDTFWAHRTSSDPQANMTVSLGTGWTGWRLGEQADCGGPGFSGWPGEGWNAMRQRFYDCLVGGYGIVGPLVVGALLLGSGGFGMMTAWRRSRQAPG